MIAKTGTLALTGHRVIHTVRHVCFVIHSLGFKSKTILDQPSALAENPRINQNNSKYKVNQITKTVSFYQGAKTCILSQRGKMAFKKKPLRSYSQ